MVNRGSIPARAGKPVRAYPKAPIFWVYPRTGGETISSRCTSRVPLGLSPHGRGNLIGVASDVIDKGSIPARAGKPRLRESQSRRVGVYPRTGGETSIPVGSGQT